MLMGLLNLHRYFSIPIYGSCHGCPIDLGVSTVRVGAVSVRFHRFRCEFGSDRNRPIKDLSVSVRCRFRCGLGSGWYRFGFIRFISVWIGFLNRYGAIRKQPNDELLNFNFLNQFVTGLVLVFGLVWIRISIQMYTKLCKF